MKFYTKYNPPSPVTCVPDTETKWVDQSEADRVSLKYQLERYGMDSLLQQFEKTKSQFGYADTRVSSSFGELAQKLADANQYFQQLPSGIRKKFEHSAVKFYESIEKNPEQSYKDGYISKDLAKNLGVKFEEPKIDIINDTTPVVDTQPVKPVETVESTVVTPNENVSA